MIDALLESGLLTVFFQPIVDLTTASLRGYEALGRVSGPPQAQLAPDVRLDRAVREGRLLALDRAWRRAAIERIAAHPRIADEWFFLNIDSRSPPRATHRLRAPW